MQIKQNEPINICVFKLVIGFFDDLWRDIDKLPLITV